MRFLRPAVVLLLLLGSLAITASSLVYFDADEYAPFVLEKLTAAVASARPAPAAAP